MKSANKITGNIGENLATEYLKNLGYEILNDSQDSFTARKDGKNIDVSRQNRNGKIQKGYDILVSDMEGEIEYIEVKSKKGNEKEFFKVSGLQWEFAKKLNEEGKGDKHYVYIVTNVRDKEKIAVTRMKNPYKAWLEGKLEVDPVRIKY